MEKVIVKTISGTGVFKGDGREIGSAEYKITITPQGATKVARGYVRADNDVLARAFEAKELVLIRDDCRFEIACFIKTFNFGSEADLGISGSPGPY